MAQRRDSSLKSTRLLAHLRGIVAAVRAGQLDERGDASLFDRDAAEMVHLTNELIDELVRPLRVASGSLAEIAAGNIPDFVIDEYQGEFDTIKRNINTFLATMQGMQHEAQDLISAITSGKLHARGNDWDFQGGWRDLIGGMNNVVDAFERPFAVAKGCVQEISDGRMPPPIERGFKGDYGRLAKDLNGLVCTVRTMTSAIVALSQSAVSGELDRRLNSNEFSGDWAALVTGINATLDAALAPIKEAGEVLGRVADYDLRVRVEGDYAGDHARIKNAVNQTTDTLNRALLQVSQSAEAVANGSGRIAEMSREVTVGTKRQVVAVEDVTRRAGTLLAQAEANAKLSKQALLRAEEVVVSVDAGKSSAERAAGVIEEIVCATEASTAVIQEINAIAAQTDSLAGSANAEAAKVAASGRGFAVVADEVRRLAQQSKIAANKMDSLVVEIGRILRVQGNGSEVTTRDALFSVIQEIQQIAFQTNMLAVNAAVEAAHVAAASAGFEAITDEVRNLAQRVKGAAERTDTLTRSAHTAAENGREITRLVERDLSQIVEGVREMIGSMQEIADKSGDQQVAMRAMTAAMGEIQAVTDSNARSAGSSTTVADSLASEVSALANLVGRFKLDEAGGRESKCSRATPKA